MYFVFHPCGKLLSLFIIIWFISGCQKLPRDLERSDQAAGKVLDQHCYSCHKSYTQEKIQELIRSHLIIPGHPELSPLFRSIKKSHVGGAENMPLYGDIPKQDVELLRNYILNLRIEDGIKSVQSQSQAWSEDQLTEEETFYRCYSHLTRTRPPSTDPVLLKIGQKKMTASQGCLEIIESAAFNQQGVLKNPSKRNKNVLMTFQSLHNNWFPEFNFFAETNDNGTFDVLDAEEMGLYYTKSLFDPQYPLQSALITKTSLQAIRQAAQKNTWTIHPFRKVKLSQARFITGLDLGEKSQYWRPELIQVGDLIGIRTYKKNQSVIPKLVNARGNQIEINPAREFLVNKDVHENHGGGLLGSEPFLVLNFGLGVGEKVDGGMKTPRLWSKAIVENLLCRNLPVIHYTDALPFVQNQSQLSFRKNASCMACHATMDNMAYVIRNMEMAFSSPGDNGAHNLVQGRHMKIHPPGIKIPIQVPPDADSEFHERPPEGRFFYRTLKGEMVDKKISSLHELGQSLQELDDYYLCLTGRYWHFFTGVKINLEKIYEVATANPGTRSDEERQVANFILSESTKLKKQQSLKSLIKAIMDHPLYRKR